MIHYTLIVLVIKMLLKFILLYLIIVFHYSRQKLNYGVKRDRENRPL